MSLTMLQHFLGWTTLINYLLLTTWFVLFSMKTDRLYHIHKRWFDLSERQFACAHYAGMLGFKLLTFILFLAPYLALCIVV